MLNPPHEIAEAHREAICAAQRSMCPIRWPWLERAALLPWISSALLRD
ncbi:MAG: hypothetical protein ABF454_09130 [Zymomonas mobilis]